MEIIGAIKKPYRNARWHLAKLWLRLHPDVDVIGIAGSVGKTSAKEMLSNILGSAYDTIYTIANLAPSYNIPLTVLRIRKQSKLIAEMSIDSPGQMEKHISLIQPRIGVMTRLTLEHTDSEHFGSLETAVEEEAKLLSSLPKYGWAVLNGDDETIRSVADKAKCTRLMYGFREDNDIVISDCETSFFGADVATSFSLKIGGIKRQFQINLLGDTNVLAAVAGICVGMITGMNFDQIRKGLLLSKPRI
ncbi:MAG: Mur ligase family protein [bacterium]